MFSFAKAWLRFAGLALAGVAGCADPVAPEAPAPGPVIGHIRGRDQTITVYSSPSGPRFAVSDLSGKLVASDLSAEAFEARHPDLYRAYRSSLAPTRQLLDASLEPRAQAKPEPVKLR
jgi:hypothetical protein